MAVFQSELVLYVFLALGLCVCFAGIYSRKIFSAVTGFAAGYIAYEFALLFLTWSGMVNARQMGMAFWAGQLVLAGILAVFSFFAPRSGSAVCAFILAFMAAYSVMSSLRTAPEFLIRLAICSIAGLAAGWAASRANEKGTVAVTALFGALIAVAAGHIITWMPAAGSRIAQMTAVIQPLFIGMIQQNKSLLSAIGLLAAGGMFVQAQAMAAVRSRRWTKRTGRPRYGLKNLSFKQLLLFLFPLAAFVLQPLSSWLRVNAGRGSHLRTIAQTLDNRFSVGYTIASGMFIGCLIFFVWYYDVWTGFVYQLLYLLWIPMDMLAGTAGGGTGLLGAPPKVLVPELLRYLLLFGILCYLNAAVLSRTMGIVLSVAAAVLLYPYGIFFLKGYRVGAVSVQQTDLILWGAVVSGLLISIFLCDPEISTNQSGRYEHGKGAWYCHKCGERRKAGYLYCGSCGEAFHHK